MLELGDYLDLTFASAAAQWRGLLTREYAPVGLKQEDFTPVETLLCFGLGLVGNRSKSGKINIPVSSPDAKRLGALFKRTPGSLAPKLANLDGRRAHRAKHEQQLWIRLTEDRFRFEMLYALILDAGRSIGLDEEKLPDFLGVQDNRLQIVFEAYSVSDDDLLASLEGDFATLAGRDDIIDIRDTERALLGTARVGQQQFARKVLTNSDFACVFCGLSTRSAGLPSSRLLIASHIKPWSKSGGGERVDPRNGLAACPTHDAAFEAYLISVDADGRIVRSAALDRAIASERSWRHNFGDNGLAPRLMMPSTGTMPSAHYTDWHYSQLMVEFLN
ncbi:HNH endonuclease [Cryobacterium sp. M96]|uniref:HNH endonuclease n=1 Tax=Cryobacterium sp. M96 TaxID=2048295 RepID=UPI0011B05E28|nr:HNH endonuclease signature motif containing protein [Cryobacterium sp. M96]